VRLTVLGKSPAWQDADGACSGYLIEDGETAVLIDCGNGVFSKLRKYRDYVAVDAVVLSHLHADHFLDLVPYSYALLYAPRQQPVPVDRFPGTDTPARPILHGPTGATAVFDTVTGAWGAPGLIGKAFDIREYATDDVLEVGSLRLRFSAVPHFLPTNAIEITSSSGPGRIVYGSDHRPSDEIVAFARGADLLLLEATLPRPERHGDRGHLTPEEAGQHAAKAGAGQLVLVHMSDEMDELWARACAEEAFGGPVEVAAEGQVYEV
jgi:ribonuclease BN (tRNA processing enzyme)